MESWLFLFFKIATVHFLAVASPGPDFALVLRNTMMGSRKAGIYTSLGIMFGIAVHLSYCIFGLLVIIRQSEAMFNGVKIVCALYLLYLGIQALRYRPSATSNENEGNQTLNTLRPFDAVRQGFVCNLLNPKAALFFWSLFSVIILPTTPIWLQLAMGMEMMAMNFVWFAFVAYIASMPTLKQKLPRFQKWTTWLMGGILIYFGVELAFMQIEF